MNRNEKLIGPHGGYRKLKSFQVAQLVYDLTVRFCDRYISIKSRTHDQMVQAARSGVQNIAEGSQASSTSKKFEIKLTNVARASLEELKLDYEDFLRQRNLIQWDRENPLRQELVDEKFTMAEEVVRWIREVHDRINSGQSRQNRPSGLSEENTLSTSSTKSISYQGIAANVILTFITVSCYLLDRQIAVLADNFEKEGGFTEKLYNLRKNSRNG